MFLKQAFSVLLIHLALCGNAMSTSTPVDAKGFVETLSANLALSPFMKTRVSLHIDSSLGEPYLLNPTLSEDGVDFKLLIRPEALNNPILIREALARVHMHVASEITAVWPQIAAKNAEEVETLTQKKRVLSQQLSDSIVKYEIPEMFMANLAFQQSLVYLDAQINARLGSVIAQSQLAKMELNFEKDFRLSTKTAKYLLEMPAHERAKVIQEYAALKKITIPGNAIENLFTETDMIAFKEKSLTITRLAQKDQLRREKSYRDPGRVAIRDEARLKTKLDELLKKNDREGVARLFEAMFPWELMESTEVSAWKSWIESIRRPSKDVITLYRGLDKYDRSIKTGSATPGFFAAMINRNQGSYSDRLRSLATSLLINRQQDLTSGLGQKFFNHSLDGPRSPFISFSLDFKVASMFAETGLIVVQVDRRRAVTNMFSPMKAEAELLVPLVIFPDEVRSVHSAPLSEHLAEEVVKNTGVLLPKNFVELTENGKIYSDFYTYMMGLQNQAASQKNCSRIFVN